MIDLKRIEEKIDSILASETNESLTSWLINKRNKEVNHLLGDGSFVSMAKSSFTFCPSASISIKQENNTVSIDTDNLPFAA